MRRFSHLSGTILTLLFLLVIASSALAELSVVIGYDTRAVGEIDACG